MFLSLFQLLLPPKLRQLSSHRRDRIPTRLPLIQRLCHQHLQARRPHQPPSRSYRSRLHQTQLLSPSALVSRLSQSSLLSSSMSCASISREKPRTPVAGTPVAGTPMLRFTKDRDPTAVRHSRVRIAHPLLQLPLFRMKIPTHTELGLHPGQTDQPPSQSLYLR
jgi:hypothetical protein